MHESAQKLTALSKDETGVIGAKIFKIKKETGRNQNHQTDDRQSKFEYTRIRTKKIEYLESPSIAVYFENVTQHVE